MVEPNELSINLPGQASSIGQLFGQANVIGNIDEADDSHDFSHQSQPRIQTQTNRHSNVTKVLASDLRNFVKSKEDLYVILSIEGQLHLPPYDECTMEFMRDALSGRKRLITNRDLAPVNVPRYKEFNAVALYKAGIADEELKLYLPDPPTKESSKVINRRFLFNVSHRCLTSSRSSTRSSRASSSRRFRRH